jgi:predicted phage tail protein
MLTTIKLNGILGVEFAPEIKGELNTPQEIVNFLCCNFPDFRHYVLGSEWHYTMVVRGNNWERYIIEDSPSVLLPVTGCVVEITPVIESSGRTLTSIAMIGIGIALVATGAASGLGMSLILSGATSLLSSLINGNPKKNEEARSTFFQAPGYNVKEGTPIPLVFGEVLVKNFQVLSNEISSPVFPYVDPPSQEQNMAAFAKCPIMFIQDVEEYKDSGGYPSTDYTIALTVSSTTLTSPILAGQIIQLVYFHVAGGFYYYINPNEDGITYPCTLILTNTFNIGDTKIYCNPNNYDEGQLSFFYNSRLNEAIPYYKGYTILVQSQTYP